MTPREALKLKLVAWPLVTLAVLQIAFGSYPVYPFIHWTMFAFKEPDELSTAISRDVVLAVNEQGETRNLNFNHLFGAVPGSGGAAKAVEKSYLRRLRAGDAHAALELAALAHDELAFDGIVRIVVENRHWKIDETQLAWTAQVTRVFHHPLQGQGNHLLPHRAKLGRFHGQPCSVRSRLGLQATSTMRPAGLAYTASSLAFGMCGF